MSNDITPPIPPNGGPTPPAPGQQPQVVVVEQRKSRAGRIVLFILLGFVLLIGGCVALIGTAADQAADSIQESIDERAADEALVEDNATITACGVGDNGWGLATVEFTNPLDEEKGFISVEINFLDANDVVLGSGTVRFENLSPGQSAVGEATAFDLVDGADVDRCEVVDGTVL